MVENRLKIKNLFVNQNQGPQKSDRIHMTGSEKFLFPCRSAIILVVNEPVLDPLLEIRGLKRIRG